MENQKAIFAAGCFWGVEGYIKQINGVISTTVGYAGGNMENPSYEQVSSGKTGHAEAILVEFNPEKISYEELLKHFFRLHDPTSRNRQGNDVGTQYRSAVFFFSEEQKETAEKIKAETQATRADGKAIVTEILPSDKFFPAEDYHQDYLAKNPGGYCHIDLGLARKIL